MGHVLMLLGFLFWSPIGLLFLGFLIARRKFGAWRTASYAGEGHMFSGDRWERKMGRLQEKIERMRSRGDPVRSGGDVFRAGSSGNSAFDDYRTQTLKRLEDEQNEFKDFLARLRFAKDRSEFDQFMADRRERPAASEPRDEGGVTPR